jgi:Fe-S oxidoreductase
VVKDQLNAALADHGLFFPLELSTSNRATIGGMISTDASGQGSCLYGKTRNHVLELITVLLDGTVWTSRPLQDQELQHIQRRADLVGAVHRLVLVQDAFTSWYESHVVLAVLDLMQAIDFRPYIAPFRPNGKPSHLHGFLGAFTRAATCNAAMLRDLAAIGVELVGVDASMTLTYRSEYGMLDEADRPPPVLLIQEWLALHRDAIPKAPSAGDEYLLLPHCSERSLALSSLRHWQTAFAAAGASLRVLPSGCCGMAGTYGHEAEHRTTSEQIYGMSWGRQVGKWAQSGHLLAAGYSCRSQVKIMDRQVLAHPAQALLACLGRS